MQGGWSETDKADALAAILADQGISVLRNEMLDVSGLQISGMDDLWAGRFSAEQALASVDLSRLGVSEPQPRHGRLGRVVRLRGVDTCRAYTWRAGQALVPRSSTAVGGEQALHVGGVRVVE